MLLFRDFITLYITVEMKFYSLWITTIIIASVFVYDVTVYSNSFAPAMLAELTVIVSTLLSLIG